jgi:hypothetical protein
VDGIKEKMGDDVNLIHLNLLSSPGRKAAQAFGVAVAPTTLIFSGDGQLNARATGLPDKDRLLEEVERALPSRN